MVRREVSATCRGTSRWGPLGRSAGHPARQPPRLLRFPSGHEHWALVQYAFRKAGRGPGRRGASSSGKSRLNGGVQRHLEGPPAERDRDRHRMAETRRGSGSEASRARPEGIAQPRKFTVRPLTSCR